MNKKTHSKSSKRWLQEHFSDQYVQDAQKAGHRSRAIYKLMAMQEKDRILKSGQIVVDLGAAPGSWSQYAVQLVGEQGEVFALDCLEMESIVGTTFLQGDFTEEAVYDAFLALLDGRVADVVLSDMAPNMSGTPAVDQPKSMYLAEIALDFAISTLKKRGTFAVKVFQGDGFDPFLKAMRQNFAKVVVRKPPASRPRSREVYLVGKDFLAKNH